MGGYFKYVKEKLLAWEIEHSDIPVATGYLVAVS